MFSALTANNITPLQYQYPTLTPLRWPTTGIVRIWNITYHMKTYHSPTSLKAELFSLSWLLPSILLRVGQLDWLMDLVFAVVTIVTYRNKLGHFIITDLRTKLEWSWVLDGCYVVSDQVKLYILFLWMSIDMNINIKVDEEYLDIDIYTSTVCAFAKWPNVVAATSQLLLYVLDVNCK